MGNYKDFFGSFLKAEDLPRPVNVVIETVGLESIKNEDGVEKKLVAKFVGKDKRLVLNLTNCETLAALANSTDFTEWPGLSVQVFPTTTKFGAKTVPCLRLRGVGNARTVEPVQAREVQQQARRLSSPVASQKRQPAPPPPDEEFAGPPPADEDFREDANEDRDLVDSSDVPF